MELGKKYHNFRSFGLSLKCLDLKSNRFGELFWLPYLLEADGDRHQTGILCTLHLVFMTVLCSEVQPCRGNWKENHCLS